MIVTVAAFGDTALLAEVGELSAAHGLVARIEAERAAGRAPAAVGEPVVGLGNVVVHLHPDRGPPETVEAWLCDLAERPLDRRSDQAGRQEVVIPVVFDGPDLGEVATALATGADSVVAQLCGSDLRVAFLGFAPGFPYLVGLPPGLASVPRRATPRPAVPAGSVAVAAGFASVYPQATPGGWMLLGRTSLPLFDPDRPPYARLRAGDTVRFVAAADAPGPGRGQGTVPDRSASFPRPSHRPLLGNRVPHFAEVVEPGLLTLVQDHGRRSAAGLGVPRAGPADPEAMRLANRLVGNHDGAAALEATAVGPGLRLSRAAHLAVVGMAADGVEVRLNGRPVASDAVVPVERGQVLTVGRVRAGLRAYVAVAGGFETPVVLGSRSSDVLCHLGPGALRAGDRLDLGPPSRPHGFLLPRPTEAGSAGPRVVRVLPGPHRLPPGLAPQLLSRTWRVDEASNRIGIRLLPDEQRDHRGEGDRGVDRPTVPHPGGIPSTGMVTGAIQLPPDGHPIVLMPDHATVGGYPVAGCVISADLPVLGQLAPGDTLHFAEVDRQAARLARDRWERSLDGRVSGWFPTAAGT